jgi:uncharacterized phage protein (TIGR02220 family)
MKEGFIMLGRDLQDSPLFNEKRFFSKFEAWIDILYEVNYKDGSSLIGSTIIECKNGQSIMSLDSWAKRWKWNKSAVRRFFDLLKSCNMIEIENMTKTTRITVLLSNSYDDLRNASETQVKRKWNASETHLTPIEESNKVIKKERNKKEDKSSYGDLLVFLNSTTGKGFKVITSKADKNIKARIKDGFTNEDIKKAIVNCSKNKYHIENPQYLTLEFITRADNLEKYLNANPTQIIPLRPHEKGFNPISYSNVVN